MSKFSRLQDSKKQSVDTIEYEMYQIELDGKSPVLFVKPATESNKPYFNALLKRQQRAAKRIAAGRMDAGLLAQNREEDRKLYPQYVITGWKYVVDDQGEEVKFTKEDCADFLNAVDDWIVDELRNFCASPANFSGDYSLVMEEAGKNS